MISGFGFAIAKTIGSFAIVLIISVFSAPATDTPKNTMLSDSATHCRSFSIHSVIRKTSIS